MNNLFVSNLFNNQNQIIKEGLINRIFFNVGDTILSFDNLQRRNRDLNKLLLDIISLTFTLNFSVNNSNYQNIYNSYYIKNNILYLYINPTYLPYLDFVGSAVNSEGNLVKDFQEQNPEYTFTVTKYIDDTFIFPEPILTANKTFFEVSDSNAVLTLTNTHPEYTYKWYKWNNQTNNYDILSGKTGEVLQYNLTNTSKIKVEAYARNKTYTKIVTLYKKSDAIQTGYYKVLYNDNIMKYGTESSSGYYEASLQNTQDSQNEKYMYLYFKRIVGTTSYTFDTSINFRLYLDKLFNKVVRYYYDILLLLFQSTSDEIYNIQFYESLISDKYHIYLNDAQYLSVDDINFTYQNKITSNSIFSLENVADIKDVVAPLSLISSQNKIIITHDITLPLNGLFKIIDPNNIDNYATYPLNQKIIEITKDTSPISYNSPIELNFKILNDDGSENSSPTINYIKIYQNEVNIARLIRQQNDLSSFNFNPYKFIIEIQEIMKSDHKLKITSGAYNQTFELGLLKMEPTQYYNIEFELPHIKIENINFKILDNGNNPVNNENTSGSTLAVGPIRLNQANVDFHKIDLSPGYHNTHVATFTNFDASGHTVSSDLMKFSHIVL